MKNEQDNLGTGEDAPPSNSKMTKAQWRVSFGYRVQQRRKALGLSQAEVSRAVNKERTSVSQWENNRAAPHQATLLSLAKILNCRPEFLLSGRTKGTPVAVNQTQPLRSILDRIEVCEIELRNLRREYIDHLSKPHVEILPR